MKVLRHIRLKIAENHLLGLNGAVRFFTMHSSSSDNMPTFVHIHNLQTVTNRTSCTSNHPLRNRIKFLSGELIKLFNVFGLVAMNTFFHVTSQKEVTRSDFALFWWPGNRNSSPRASICEVLI